MSATLSLSPAQRATRTQPVLAENESAQKMELHVLSEALLQGQKSVSIVHNGSTYRLQATKLGKLILTK